MTDQELAILTRGMAPVIRDVVAQAMSVHYERMALLVERVAALEQRPVIHGRDGRDGAPGERGKDGADGRDGKDADPAVIVTLQAQVDALRSLVDELADASLSASKVRDIADERIVKAFSDAVTATRVDTAEIEPLVDAAVQKAVASLPTPVDGKDGHSVTVADVAPLIRSEIAEAIKEFPRPVDGKDGSDGTSVTVDDVRPLIAAEVSKAMAAVPVPKDGVNGKDGAAGKDGKSISVDDVRPLIATEVKAAIASIPVPKDGIDGTSVTVADVQPIIAAEVSKAVAAIPIPKDGIGAAGAVIDRHGCLVMTLSDGTALNLGGVVGKDADMDALRSFIAAEVAKIPIPKDGRDGIDGKDGKDGRDGQDGKDGFTFGPEDFLGWDIDATERVANLRFKRGDREKTLTAPVKGLMVFKDVWRDGNLYEKGDVVTHASSTWVCVADVTNSRPGLNTPESRAWKMCVKKGADGKSIQGPPGPPGPRGPQGDRGPDRW